MGYHPENAVTYAHIWAYARNPRYYDFSGIGGDCTNFISQCLYAGCKAMNYTPDLGWFYLSPKRRSAAWSGVQYLFRFLTTNRRAGPYGHEAPLTEAVPGDVVQLSFDGSRYTHSLLVVEIGKSGDPGGILIATHTYDADNRALNTYSYVSHRLIHIDGARA
jgi:hypothetical protein